MPTAARLTLCTVVSPDEADITTNQARTREANAALARAQADIQPFHDAELQLREGPPIGRLMDELLTERATIVTVGSRANGRAGLGSVASAMLHDAPCSVLIAHTDDAGDGEVVVGFDGSGGARRALAVGRELSERLSLHAASARRDRGRASPGSGMVPRGPWAGHRPHRGSTHGGRSTHGCILCGRAADPRQPSPARCVGALEHQRASSTAAPPARVLVVR